VITYDVPASKCPVCEVERGAATSVHDKDGKGPTPGALTVCAYCAAVLQYDANLQLRKVSDGRREQYLRQSPELRLAVACCEELILRRSQKGC
jgi:hypothetical protein